MDITTEEFVKIADKSFKNHEEELKEIYEKIHYDMLISMKNKNLNIHAINQDKELLFLPSWETILLESRLSEKIKSCIDITILFTDNYFKINKEVK